MSRPYLILIVCNLFWGGNTVAAKLAVGHIDAYSLTILRWVGALILVLPFAIRPLQRDWPVIRTRWWLYLLYGAVGFTSFNMLMYIAAHYTSGVNASLEQVAVNIFVLLLNFTLFRLKVHPLQLVGVAVTIAGVALIATHGDLGRILKLDVNLRPALPDHHPKVQVEPGLIRINGLYRHGWLLAPALLSQALQRAGLNSLLNETTP